MREATIYCPKGCGLVGVALGGVTTTLQNTCWVDRRVGLHVAMLNLSLIIPSSTLGVLWADDTPQAM